MGFTYIEETPKSSKFSYIEETKTPKKENIIWSYLKNAQPAFKLALTQPETMLGRPALGKGGIPLTPEQLEEQVNKPWDTIYRDAGLPFSKSTSMAGQMIPQIAGMALDIGTRPSAMIAPPVIGAAGKAMANNPVTRRFLQTQLPTLSKKLLSDNPIKSVYKEIDGFLQNITKPLAKSPEKLVSKGVKVAESINKTIDKIGEKYTPLVGKEPLKTTEVIDIIPAEIGDKLGVKVEQITNTSELWKARDVIRKAVSTNPYEKAEFFKKTNLKEDSVMELMNKMKAKVMDKMTPDQRIELDILDSQYEKAITSGKALLQRIYNPKTGVVHVDALKKALSSKESDTTQLFNSFSYFDKNVTKFQNDIIGYVARQQMMKKLGTATKWAAGATGLSAIGKNAYEQSIGNQ
jgi:hypothetical protein